MNQFQCVDYTPSYSKPRTQELVTSHLVYYIVTIQNTTVLDLHKEGLRIQLRERSYTDLNLYPGHSFTISNSLQSSHSRMRLSRTREYASPCLWSQERSYSLLRPFSNGRRSVLPREWSWVRTTVGLESEVSEVWHSFI